MSASEYTAAILDELRAINRKLASYGKTSESLTRAFSALAERVQRAIGDMPAAAAPVFTVGQVIDIGDVSQPPLRSIVRDCEADEWYRGAKGWGISRYDGSAPWSEVVGFGPLTVIKVGDGDV